MIFPGFPSIQASTAVPNAPARPTLGGSPDASFAEVALGLIGSIALRAAPRAAHIDFVDNQTGKPPVSTARIAPGALSAAGADNSVARASISAAPSTPAVASAGLPNSNAPNSNPPTGNPTTASMANAPFVAPVALTAPAALTSSQARSMFSCVLTPAQYLENVMAQIQSGAPTASDKPMTVAQVLQQALDDNYSTPQNPYAECSDPAAAAALIARIAGPNANVLVPTVAGMTTAYIPSTPAGWVGNYTMGYATQSSGFNDASETF